MNKNYSIPVLLFLIFSQSLTAQVFNIADGGTVTACEGVIVDSGGIDGNYGDSENYTLTVCKESDEECLQLDFLSFNIESGFDDLFIYDGPDASSPLLVELTGDIDPAAISASGDCLTLVFTTDGSVTRPGFEIAITCACPSCDDGIQNGQEIGIDCGGPDCEECDFILISEEGPFSSCEAQVFDSGGATGNYGNNEHYEILVCGDDPEGCLQLDFLSFNIENFYDSLYVYDGLDATAPLLAALTGNIDPGIISATGLCVYLVFDTDGSVTAPGFDIQLTCVCPTCDDGIQNGQEISVDCGGPDCEDCDFDLISEEGTITGCDFQLLDAGITGNYGPGENYTMTICGDSTSGDCLHLDFNSFDLAFGDQLVIYDGSDTDGFLQGVYGQGEDPDVITLASGCATFVFTSGTFSAGAPGFDISITCTDDCPTCDDGIQNGLELGVDCGAPGCDDCQFVLIGQTDSLISCEAQILDSGGSDGNYADNEHYEMLVCGDDPEGCLQLDFLSFDIENFFDSLYVYDGIDTSAPILATLTGNIDPGLLSATGSCVYLVFDTDGSVTRPGFEIQLTCACPTCDDGIQNGQEISVDCGGPDCEDCDFNIISEGGTLNGCDFQLLDAGITENYGPGENYTMTFCSDSTSGDCLQLDFNSFELAFGDELEVYDGLDASGFLQGSYGQGDDPGTIVMASGCATFVFTSGQFSAGAPGFDISISCTDVCPTCNDGIQNGLELGVDCGGPDCEECDFILITQEGTVNTCGTTLFDSGGADGPYSNGENAEMTICSIDPESCVQLEFISFEIENNFDFLTIYDGPDTSFPLVAQLTDTQAPDFISTGSSCLTLVFTSDGSIFDSGFEIAISCICPTCDDGIQNGQEIDIDCGGPDCEACEFNIISEGGTLTGCDFQLLDSGAFENYSPGEVDTMTFCSDGTSGECLQLVFNEFDLAFGDQLAVYDGPDTDGFLFDTFSQGDAPGEITMATGCATFVFTSGQFSQGAPGFDVAISCTDVCPTCDDGIQNGLELGTDCGGPDCEECDFVLISQEGTITTCSTTIFDSGGPDEDYSDGEDYTMTICSEIPDGCLQLDFISFEIENGFDNLFVYDGSDDSSPLIATVSGNDDPGVISATGGCITLQFTTDGSVTDPGFEIAITCQCPTCDDGIMNGEEVGIDCGGPDCPECDFVTIDQGGTYVTCDGQLLDDGLFENYSNNSQDTITICSENGECLSIDFLEFEVESFFDQLDIYEGTDPEGELLGSYTGTLNSTSLSTYTPCATFVFFSDGSINYAGFDIDITCATCPTCDDGIQNGTEQGVDCGGPECEPCPCEDGTISALPFETDSTTCGAATFDGTNVCGPDFVTPGAVITYEYSPETDEVILMEFNDFVAGSGIASVTAGCPTDPSATCVGVYQSGFNETSITQILSLDSGITYFFSLFTNAFNANCTDFQFILTTELPIPTEQDCFGAIPVCDFMYVQENAYTGEGNYPAEVDGATVCLDGETNSVWYTFTVLESGVLNFVIDPIAADNDYDWAVFDLTDASCADIFADESLLVSCNSYGLAGTNGPTGISTAMGGVGNNNGPGNQNGPIFNEDVNVEAGNTYVLIVEDWDGSPEGYTLDFGGSTAQLFYPGPPFVSEIVPENCRQVLVRMSEPIDCDSISMSTFDLIPVDDDVQIPVIDSIDTGCEDGSTTFIRLYLSAPLPDVATMYDLTVSSGSGSIVDLCGNFLTQEGVDTTFNFTTPQWITLASEITDTECLEEIGVIDFSTVFGGTPPLIYEFEGMEVDDPVVMDLGAGTYTVDITDALGCHHDQELTVMSNIEEVEIVMPNVITPNDDESNDLFGPKAISRTTGEDLGLIDHRKHFGQYRLEVFNRWGKAIFIGTLGEPFWDGTSEGGPVHEGTYFYVITYSKSCTEIDPGQKELKGTVTVLR